MKEEVNFDNKSHEEIVLMVNDWMNYYNNDRLQWGLAKLSPNEYWEYITTGEYPKILKSQGFKLPSLKNIISEHSNIHDS